MIKRIFDKDFESAVCAVEVVDVFINKIFIYEDDEGKPKKLTILCNTQDGQMDVSLEDLKTSGSSKGRLVRPTGFEPAAFRVGADRSIQLSYGRTSMKTVRRRVSAIQL